MYTHSDLLIPVGRANRKLDAPPINFGNLRFADYESTNRCRRQMAHVDVRAERAFAGVEIWFDRVESCILHDHDHDRRRQDWGQCHILESAGEMVGHHDKTERTLGADRYRLHGLSLLTVADGNYRPRARAAAHDDPALAAAE